MLGLMRLLLRLHSPHKQPVVDIAQRVRHVWLRLIVPPLAIDYEFVLMVPAGSWVRGQVTLRCSCAFTGFLPIAQEMPWQIAVVQIMVRALSRMPSLSGEFREHLNQMGDRHAYPGGRCTMTVNRVGDPSTTAIGTVSTHLVNDPQR